MSVIVSIPKLLPPMDPFDASIANNGNAVATIDVTVSVTPKGSATAQGRSFSMDGKPKAKLQRVSIAENDDEAFTVSDWGAVNEGDVVVVTADGVSSNKATVISKT